MRRSWVRLAIVLVCMAFAVTAAAPFAFAAPRAKGVTLDQTAIVIDLATGNTAQLSGTVYPADADQRMEFSSGNKSIATISSTGLITAKKTGKVYVYAKPRGVSTKTRCTVTVIDSLRPTTIQLSVTKLSLIIGETAQVTATPMPSTAEQGIRWASTKNAVASVTPDGTILARKPGKVQIRAYSTRNASLYKYITVTVSNPPKPTRIDLSPADKSMNVGETLTLSAAPYPSNAGGSVSWSSSNKKIATVSSTGVVTALRKGTVKITATSKLNSRVKTVRTLNVYDPYTVESIAIGQGDLYLMLGENVQLSSQVTPATASGSAVWSSSNASVVSVDSQGYLQAKSAGIATISLKAPNGIGASITVGVLDSNYALAVPERTTPVSGISSNLNKIDDIRISAFQELTRLQSSGLIKPADAQTRKDALVNAFAMSRFPWMTDKFQPYWSTKTVSKGYQPNLIYYGMPYIQNGSGGNDSNRRFDLTKAVSNGYFQLNGSYYKMTSKRLNGYYVGSDCSSFVSMSIFGMNHPASFLRTTSISTSSYYRTVSNPNEMMPGDLLNKKNSHVVMFLYYTNSAKTHMMILEQGGGTEPNTIACRNKSVSSYTTSGYVIRRPVRYN